jgi:uncharacterized protein YjiS (DUF1127 family)
MAQKIVDQREIGPGVQHRFARFGSFVAAGVIARTRASGLWRAAGRFLNPPAPTASQRRVMKRLQRLDDYLIADIGISRSDIPYVYIEGGRPSAWRRRVRR